MRVIPAAWDDADVQRLTAAQQAELRARYDGEGEPGTPPSAADVSVVLAALEAAARSRGWTTLRLETGPRQPEAIALYEGAGYRAIPAFGAYVDHPDAGCSLYYERVLDGS
ncbi:GNAT family N-acetyltransferase [Geodermatophilus sp. SYSU D00700]